eukprot:8096731-Lingulodinium_polyedra.AAC.1
MCENNSTPRLWAASGPRTRAAGGRIGPTWPADPRVPNDAEHRLPPQRKNEQCQETRRGLSAGK